MEELQQAVDGCCVRLWQLVLLIGGHRGCIDGGFVAWREALFDNFIEVIPSLLVSHLFSTVVDLEHQISFHSKILVFYLRRKAEVMGCVSLI
jgi:hypothetical protein